MSAGGEGRETVCTSTCSQTDRSLYRLVGKRERERERETDRDRQRDIFGRLDTSSP